MDVVRLDGHVICGTVKEWIRVADALTLTQGYNNQARRLVDGHDLEADYGIQHLATASADSDELIKAVSELGLGEPRPPKEKDRS
jgi:hypothetical protein